MDYFTSRHLISLHFYMLLFCRVCSFVLYVCSFECLIEIKCMPLPFTFHPPLAYLLVYLFGWLTDQLGGWLGGWSGIPASSFSRSVRQTIFSCIYFSCIYFSCICFSCICFYFFMHFIFLSFSHIYIG